MAPHPWPIVIFKSKIKDEFVRKRFETNPKRSETVPKRYETFKFLKTIRNGLEPFETFRIRSKPSETVRNGSKTIQIDAKSRSRVVNEPT